MTFLADTNVISELVRRDPNPGVLSWGRLGLLGGHQRGDRRGDLLRARLEAEPTHPRVDRAILAEDCQISPVTIEIARCSGVLRGRFAARGRQRTQADMLIAATAQLNQLTLVTRNIRDFENCGVALLDPFS